MFRDTPIHSKTQGANRGRLGRSANQPAQPLFMNGRNGIDERVNAGAGANGNVNQTGYLFNSSFSPKKLDTIDIQELENEYEDVVDGVYMDATPQPQASTRQTPKFQLFPAQPEPQTHSSPYWNLSPVKVPIETQNQFNNSHYQEDISGEDSDDPEDSIKMTESLPLPNGGEDFQQPQKAQSPQKSPIDTNVRFKRTLQVDEYDDSDSFIDNSKTYFKLIQRFIVIVVNTIWITIQDLLSYNLFSFAIISLVCAVIIAIFATTTFSTRDPSSPFIAPSSPPFNLEEYSNRLMSIESKLSHDSNAYSSLQIWSKDSYKALNSKFDNLESNYHKELQVISQILAKIGAQVSDQEDWSEKADKVIQQDSKLISEIRQIISAQAGEFTNIYNALDEQKDSISSLSSSINIIKDLNNDPIDFAKFVTWEDLDQKFGNGLSQLQSDISKQINDLTGKFDNIVNSLSDTTNTNSKLSELTSTLNKFEQLLDTQHSSISGQLSKVENDVRDLYQSVDSRLRNQKLEIDEKLKNSPSQALHRPQSPNKFTTPNFADSNINAKINKQVTSNAFSPIKRAPAVYRAWRKVVAVVGFAKFAVQKPEVALTPTIEPGVCWPLDGSRGNLGIRLPTDVELESVGIEHVFHKSVRNPSTAPRLVSFWVEVLDEETRGQVKSLIEQSESESGLPSTYVKVHSFEYNVFTDEPLQVFTFTKEILALRLKSRNVAFHIEENWGHQIMTCIYRVLAFGKPYQVGEVIQKEDITESETGFGDDHEVDL